MLGLQRYELPKWCHVGGLGVWSWRWGVQDVVVTGDEVGVGLIGHRELLHGTRLDQLLREGRGLENVLLGSGLGCACDEVQGSFHQREVRTESLWGDPSLAYTTPRQDSALLRSIVTTPNHRQALDAGRSLSPEKLLLHTNTCFSGQGCSLEPGGVLTAWRGVVSLAVLPLACVGLSQGGGCGRVGGRGPTHRGREAAERVVLPAEHHGACWELLGTAARDVLS